MTDYTELNDEDILTQEELDEDRRWRKWFHSEFYFDDDGEIRPYPPDIAEQMYIEACWEDMPVVDEWGDPIDIDDETDISSEQWLAMNACS